MSRQRARPVRELARERLEKGEFGDLAPLEVVERKFDMFEIEEAVREGRLVEAFAAGTAFFITPVELINFRGKDLKIPMAEGDSGAYAKVIKTWLRNIMWGKEQHKWGYVIEEE